MDCQWRCTLNSKSRHYYQTVDATGYFDKNFNDKQPTISETAKVFGTSRQNLKQVAESLQKKAFIDIKPDANDFRIQRISLTGKHEHFFLGEENEQWQKDFINSLFEGFSEEELKMFNGFMDRLILNF